MGLSIPQLRRYDRLHLLEPTGRSADSGYRYYGRGQTGAARVIALLRSMDMPIAEIRRILSGASEAERRRIYRDHRARLEARLEEVRRLLEAVDVMTEEDTMTTTTESEISGWLHLMPQLPVTDIERSIAYYEEALGFRLAWRHSNGDLAALANGEIETLLLVRWAEDGPPPQQSAYVYVEIALGRQRRQTDPEWQDWFSPGQFASFKGYSLLKADQPREAEVALQAALDGLQTPSSDKQVAVVVADLADAHVAGPAARPVACPPAPRRRLLAGEQPGPGGERDPVDRRELSATPAEPRASIVGRHGHVEQS